MKQMGEKHKEYFVRPSLFLLSADAIKSVSGALAMSFDKPAIYKALSECEKILQVFLITNR